jgi:hypothetical protein
MEMKFLVVGGMSVGALILLLVGARLAVGWRGDRQSRAQARQRR